MYHYLAILILLATLAGCSSRPTATPIPTQVPPTATVPAPTATWTATATPQATNTLMPTDTPSPMPSATPTPTMPPTATSTLTPTIEPVDASAWRVPLITAGLTVAVINALDETATAMQAGTLASIEAGGRLLGYKVAVATVAQMLEEAELPGREGRYRQDLQDNLVGVFRLIDRWQSGEVTSVTVPAELATVRASSEQTLAELMDELQRLGVSQAQIDEFMAEVNTMLEP
jgi:hypothetical protein